MRARFLSFSIVILLTASTAVHVSAQNAGVKADANQSNGGGGGAEQQAIQALKTALVNAYNAGKADAVAATFADDARITDEEGATVQGRKAVAERYVETFKENPGEKLELHPASLRFLTPDAAIEEGQAVVRDAEKATAVDATKQPTVPPAAPPARSAAKQSASGQATSQQPAAPQAAAFNQAAATQKAASNQAAAAQPARTQPAAPQLAAAQPTAAQSTAGTAAEISSYTAIFVKKNGRWLLSDLREHPAPAAAAPTPHERLQDLKWMVGSWVEEGPESISTSTCQWDESGNFLIWKYAIKDKNAYASGGTTYVGWDPLTKQITSWVFDSNGGHGQATWSRLSDDQWMAKATGILSDGRAASATQYIKKLGPDRASWTSLDRVAGGEPVPNISEFVMVRRPQQSSATKTSSSKVEGNGSATKLSVAAGAPETLDRQNNSTIKR